VHYLFASKDLIERSDLKFPFVRRRPPKLIFPIVTHSHGIQEGKEGSQDIHISIVCRSNKIHIPLNGTTL